MKNFNIENYKKENYVQIIGICKDIYKENEQGELIDPMVCYDADFLTSKTFLFNENTIEKDVLKHLQDNLYNKFENSEIVICGNTLQLWNTEDDNFSNENGKYFCLYCVQIKINNMIVSEDDLSYLFPNFGY